MPGSHHVAGANAVENRMYEHIKKSELSRGRPESAAKRIAAATVNKKRAERGEAEPDRSRLSMNDPKHWREIPPGGYTRESSRKRG